MNLCHSKLKYIYGIDLTVFLPQHRFKSNQSFLRILLFKDFFQLIKGFSVRYLQEYIYSEVVINTFYRSSCSIEVSSNNNKYLITFFSDIVLQPLIRFSDHY
jgi:hypothetical protein